MSRPVNIFMLSRITGEEEFNNVYHHAAEKPAGHQTREREIRSLRILTDRLIADGIPVAALDGIFFGYEIPVIGKEFDLLKFREGSCLSIELKSQMVPEEQIRQQLLKNRHYLGHLGIRLSLFTVVTEPMRCFRLSEDQLEEASLSEIEAELLKYQDGYLSDIDDLFQASEYLVSPVKTPDKFIRGEYFLTQAQDQVKKEILAAVSGRTGSAVFSLLGKPGTGKTLLLYDLGRTLAETGRTLIIHCGKLSDGHRMISEQLENLQIISPEGIGGDRSGLERAGFVLVDEAHRMDPAMFEMIVRTAKEKGRCCLFCLDPEKVLSRTEKNNDIAGRVAALPPDASFTLSERIRTNRQLRNFILQLQNLNYIPAEPMKYPDVSLNYAENPEEARIIIDYYRDRGYVFINYSGTAADPYAIPGKDPEPRQIIGHEFADAVMLMDESFNYDAEGRLHGRDDPEQEYISVNLFWQGITRVREKLALVVVGNAELFSKISGIVGQKSPVR